jgi:predicted site-specific integrase-resolvase
MTRQLPARALCERYSVSDRTLARWLEAGILPQPIYINHRRYWLEEELERCERERIAGRGLREAVL